MLNDRAIADALPVDKSYKLFDTDGLYLLVNSNGSKYWRIRWRIEGKEKGLSLGVWPAVGLLEARRRRDDVRRQLASGIDPAAARAADRASEGTAQATTFLVVGQEWLERQGKTLALPTIKKAEWMLNSFVYPEIGDTPIGDITAVAVLAALRKVEVVGRYETAHRVKHRIGQILRYSVATGRGGRDVTHDLREALIPAKSSHHAAIIEPVELGELLKAIDTYEGKSVVQAALRLAPMVFLRPGELRQAEWAEINLEAREWKIPAPKMKMKKAHIVPLALQAVQILSDLKKQTGQFPYVFPNDRGPVFPMSDGALSRALQRIGYPGHRMTAHGFRATARTILDEVLGFRPEWIEMQLAHAVKDPNGEAYPRMKFLPQRVGMMQQWADYLDQLKKEDRRPALTPLALI